MEVEFETLPSSSTPDTTQTTDKSRFIEIEQISKEIQTIAKSHEESERGGNPETAIEIITLLRWKQTLDAFLNASEPIATEDPLTQILRNTEDIKKQLNASPKQASPTWSQVAASAASSAQVLSATVRKPVEQTEQRRKELRIAIKNEKEKDELKRKDIRTLVTAIRAQEPRETTAQVIAAKRLQSGDILISTLTEKARRELEESNTWLRAIAPSAEARKTTFPVFVHGVRVKGVNTTNQKRAIEELCEENRLLHPDLEITRIAWPKKVIKEERSYSSFILETASPETANKIIAQGLVHEGEIKTCIRYLAEGRVTRCFNCQEYGHIANRCKKSAICAKCAGSHTTDECTRTSGEKRKCAACKGNHEAGSAYCAVERKQREKAATIRNITPPQYQYQASQPRPAISIVTQTPLPSPPQAPNQNRSQRERSSGIPIANNRKGRPTQLTQAARDPAQMTLMSTGLGKRKERDFTPPVPPPAATGRNRSQSATPFRNTFETLDSLSDEDAYQE
jgi:hypothetical protein